MRETRHESHSENLTPANIITLIRILLVPVFVIVLISPWPEWFGINGLIDNQVKSLIAAGVFIVISCTDWIDGYLARSRNEVTDFGKFMDPLADKILVAAALLALVELQVLPSWPVLIILAREFIVSGIRMLAATKGVVIAASWYGKAKTVFQILAIILFLVKDSIHPTTVDSVINSPLYITAWVVMIIALVLTIISMLDYIVKAKALLGFGNSAEGALESDSDSNIDLARRVISLANEKQIKIGTAESLTGGLIAGSLTDIPGSSSCINGGIVSYTNQVKAKALGVNEELLRENGAVDPTVAKQMAEGAAAALNADICVSVTGIAGPTGGEPGKPVGTVFMGIYHRGKAHSIECHFEGDRERIREQTVEHALKELLSILESED